MILRILIFLNFKKCPKMFQKMCLFFWDMVGICAGKSKIRTMGGREAGVDLGWVQVLKTLSNSHCSVGPLRTSGAFVNGRNSRA